MRLGEFIAKNVEPILADCETFARSLNVGKAMGRLALRNDAESILLATARDMDTSQTPAQQASKSKGHGGAGGNASNRLDVASSIHGAGRVGSGFNLVEMVSEYRALRASVLRLWRASNPSPDLNDIDDITRFNESIDQSLAKAVGAYTQRVDQARRMFLAILAHDLRNPLASISLSAKLASSAPSVDPNSSQMLSQIETSVQAIDRLIADLIDFASTGLGAAMPLSPSPMKLNLLCQEVIRETQTTHPGRELVCHTQGDLTVIADAARLRQVLSNLVGNALQHGSADTPVSISIAPQEPHIVLEVHNFGPPIPAEMLPTIFDPLVRGQIDATHRRTGSIGLGLYIVREIVTAHGGRIDVTSTESAGTRFTIHLPRQPTGATKH